MHQTNDMTLLPLTSPPHIVDARQRTPYVYSIPVPSLKFVGLPFGRYGAFSISTLIGLVTLTFDL